jgi:phospholipid/cholesterol/gamma-HCH transport system permease protein
MTGKLGSSYQDCQVETKTHGALRADAAVRPAREGRIRPMSTNAESSTPAAATGFTGAVVEWITDLGQVFVDTVTAAGDMARFAGQTISWMLLRMPRRATLLFSFYQVGVRSLPVIALTGTFIGMVLAVQSYFQFHQLGLETRLGAVINMSLVRELGPVLAATMLAGRVGSSMAAELGTMRVTEQIDALASMGANPVHHLVVPRFLACVLLIPALTIMADFMGVVGGFFYSVVILGIDSHHYRYNSEQFVGAFDLFTGVFKSLFFGATIALVSCYRGFHCAPGAEGVGRAATAAFVYSFVFILILDLVLNILLDGLYYSLWPQGAKLF